MKMLIMLKYRSSLLMRKIYSYPLILSCLILGVFSFFVLGTSISKARNKLNVLLITIDTLRADRLSCYGSQNPKTPYIDDLAERGVVFSRAFANTSTTLPSHANILLGVTPNYHGVHENLNFIVSEKLLTLAEHLKNNGYATGAFVGAYPLDSRFGLSQGFDIYDDNYDRPHTENFTTLERNAESVIKGALEWMQDRRSPWFLWIHCWDPHIPYEPPEPFKTEFKEYPYEGEVAYVDMALGKLFDKMKENNLVDSTLIIFTGDHGESLGQHGEKTHGYFAYNSSLLIPLIISHSETVSDRVGHYVSHIDIFPTVCDVLGIAKPPFLHGTSLFPALRGKNLPERPIYFESMYPYYSRGWAPLKGFMLEKNKFMDSPIPEFYDLEHDFDELNNLAGRKKIVELSSQLKNIIESQTLSKEIDAAQKVDRNIREKLASLGYISNVQVPRKKNFGIQDDVKILLPYTNKADEAWELYQEGKAEAGIKLLKEIIEERKDIDVAYKNLSFFYHAIGEETKAIAILEQGLAALPSNYEIFIVYMKMLISAQQYDKVLSSFEKANIREAEQDPAIWNNLGIAYAKKGNFKEAIKAYEMGLSLDEKLPELNNNLGNAYLSVALESKKTFHFSRSLEYYKKAIELDPKYPAPYHGLGRAYKHDGNLEGAIYCWEKALEANPNFSPALFALAQAYLNTGDKVKAFYILSDYKKRCYYLISNVERKKLDDLLEKSQK
jgi:arylsulfatase A-like enzyme/Flp pilus assembly protein TadD